MMDSLVIDIFIDIFIDIVLAAVKYRGPEQTQPWPPVDPTHKNNTYTSRSS